MSGLVIFDCDGTLVDSQHAIADAMGAAFSAIGIDAPPRAKVRGVIGLSLEHAVAQMHPEGDAADHAAMEQAFITAYRSGHDRLPGGVEPLYPGVREAIETLDAAGYHLAVATGNSTRGLNRILAAHDLTKHFISLQTADGHPSKPHPSMAHAALSDAGMEAHQAVMIGDTSYDMAMAKASAIAALGVSWGYHERDTLLAAGAHRVLDDMDNLLHHVADVLTR